MDATTLAFAGAAEQARLIRDGEVTSRAVVEATLARIAKIDPLINAYRVVLAERALAEADQADGRRGAGDARPLLGVPVAIKDDVDVAGEPTAWGTAAHSGAVVRDAEVVRRLRAAGAIIIGKTLVPELTMLPATDTTTFGSARNPWDLGRTPGGSSGGSGAAMAAGLAGVALGSDGAGSIRTPSTWNGLFGLKPTRAGRPARRRMAGPVGQRAAGAAGGRRGAVLGRDRRRRRAGRRLRRRRGARAGAVADRGEHQGTAGRDAVAGRRGASRGPRHGGAAARARPRRRRARP